MRQVLAIAIATLLTVALFVPSGHAVAAFGQRSGQGVRSTGESATTPFVFLRGEEALGVPFRIVDGLIVFSALLNDSTPVDLFLDTGFGSKGIVLFDPEMGAKLGLQYVAEVSLGGGGSEGAPTARVATGAKLSLPGISFPRQQLLVMPGDQVFSDLAADGIVGGSLFDCVVEIDYDNSVLNLYKEVPKSVVRSSERFALSFSQGIPVVEAEVGLSGKKTIPVKLLVETGAGLPLFLFTYSHPAISVPPHSITARSEGMNGTLTFSAGRVPRLKVGRFVFEDMVTAFMDENAMGTAVGLGQNGFLGHETLQMFNVVLDYPRAHMYLRPGKTYGKGYDLNMAGLVYKTNRDGTLDVFDVIHDSPAERAGMRAGDLIVAINGMNAISISPADVEALFVQEGKKVKLTVERDSKRIDFTLSLRRII